jgi:hypothetical protein
MRRIGAVCTGGLTLCSAYLHDGIGISAPANMALLQSISAALAQIQGPWVLAADWNASPEELHATRWPELAGGVIHAPSVPTCGDRCYDYFVVSRSLQHAVVATLVVSNPGFGPHRPARLFLRASPRACTIRTIDRPGRFTADLPFGPEHEPEATPAGHVIARATTTAALDVNEVAAKWFREAEAQLSLICSHTPCEARTHAGRARGPRFVWRNACGDVTSRTLESRPIQLAWRLVTGWLRDTASATSPWRRSHGKRCLLRHHHALPADEESEKLLKWLRLLDPAGLEQPSLVKGLLDTATAQVVRLDAIVRRQRADSWISWLTSGPGNGLRNQHRMSRVAGGWAPSRDQVPLPPSASDDDILDNLTSAQVDALLDRPPHAAGPTAGSRSRGHRMGHAMGLRPACPPAPTVAIRFGTLAIPDDPAALAPESPVLSERHGARLGRAAPARTPPAE